MLRRPMLLLLALGMGCSVVVNPDTDELGGLDASRPEADAGRGDASLADASPETDAGVVTMDGGGSDAGGSDAGDACPDGCDDGIDCTADSCQEGSCVHTPDNNLCDGDARCTPMGCVTERCTSDRQCDDGNACNGIERCSDTGGDPVTGCTPGSPLDCDDGVACTRDFCDPATGCGIEAQNPACDDGIACTEDICDPDFGCRQVENDDVCNAGFCTVGGVCEIGRGCVGGTERDCRDGDFCTSDRCDEASMMCISEPRDDDMDGFPAAQVGGTFCGDGTDCDDEDMTINPGAMEICDGRDNNCNGMVDEGCMDIPDTCESAVELTFDGSGVAEVMGDFADYTNNYRPTCDSGSGRGRDAVYFFDIGFSTQDVTIEVEGLSGADPIVTASLDTCRSDSIICSDDERPGVVQDSRIWLQRIRSRRVFVIVDEYRPGGGAQPFRLRVQREDQALNACGASGGPMNISGGGTLYGQTNLSTSFYGSSCGATLGRALQGLYRFTPAAATASFNPLSSSGIRSMHVRRRCGSAAGEVACVGSSSPLNATPADDGFHTLFVESNGLSPQRFVLRFDG